MFESTRKKICFSVLLHHQKDVARDMLDNIRHFCPNSSIVLFNGGVDASLCEDLGYPVCPTSRKLNYGVTATYMLEVMEWLERIDFDYDYLINLDSDALFAREGYELWIQEQMKDSDYMGVDVRTPEYDWYCFDEMRKEWDLWAPLFQDEDIRATFNVGQVFSRQLVRRLLTFEQYERLRSNMLLTQAFGIDEIAYVSMAPLLGCKIKPYPMETGRSIRYRPYFSKKESMWFINESPESFLFHPIQRDMQDEARMLINHYSTVLRQNETDHWQRLISGYMYGREKISGKPYFLRRNSGTEKWLEMVAPLADGGFGHWRQKYDSRSMHWVGPFVFGSGQIEGLSMIESGFQNLELVARTGDQLVHYYREDSGSRMWYMTEFIAKGVSGTPALIESGYGNFEVVAPLVDGGIGHWWRNNQEIGYPWFGPTIFGEGEKPTDAISLYQEKSGSLIVIIQTDGKLSYYLRDDGYTWDWHGPDS